MIAEAAGSLEFEFDKCQSGGEMESGWAPLFLPGHGQGLQSCSYADIVRTPT